MEKRFNPGAFRHKIEFLNPPTGRDDYGELLEEWTVFKSAKASKEPLLGNEFFTALTTDTKVEVKFNTRYIKGITNKMRIRNENEVYEILSAIDVKSEHKELLCYCRLVK
jgi:SPP1 family predicted phage head-tail adaptor